MSQSLRLLSSLGGNRGKSGAAKQREERLVKRKEEPRPGPLLMKIGTQFIIVLFRE